MIFEIVKKEFHSNVTTSRFIVGFIICLLLISASTYVAIQDYEQRLSDYNVAVKEHRDETLKARVYSEIQLRADREPNRLSIFNQGMDKRLPNSFPVSIGGVAMIYDGQKYGAYNPFLSLFSSVDLTFVFQVVLSLLALLFAYDAISGERENGTLKLMMSNPIPRSSVIIGKYLSALLSLFWPIFVSVIVAMLMIMFSGKVKLTGGDYVRILLIVLVSLLYVSLFYLIGLLISTRTHRTPTSLMIAMFAWVFLTLIYPSAAGFLVDRVVKSDPGEKEYSQIQELWSEFKRERDRYKEQIVPEFSIGGSSSSGSWSGSSSDILSYEINEMMSAKGTFNPESAIDGLKKYYRHTEQQRIGVAEQIWNIRKRALGASYGRKQRLITNVLRLSPAAVYDNSAAILAGTDLGSIRDFAKQVRDYRKNYIGYLNDQEAFSSEQWFRSGDKETEFELDLSGVPEFHQRTESIKSSLSRSITDVLLLIILNVVFFILSFALFVRQEVK